MPHAHDAKRASLDGVVVRQVADVDPDCRLNEVRCDTAQRLGQVPPLQADRPPTLQRVALDETVPADYFWMDECDPWYSGSRPFGKFSQSPANTTFAVVTTPTRSRDERRNFLII